MTPRGVARRTSIRHLLAGAVEGAPVRASGWVRTARFSKNVSFVHLFDGSSAATVQVVLPPDLAAAIRINGGQRVPALIFISEDGFEVARYGEKTLAKYRDEAARLGGAACSIGLVSEAENTLRQAVIAEWVDQFERAQLILRLSARLRQKYND